MMKQKTQILLIATCAALVTACSDSTSTSSSSNAGETPPTTVAMETATLPEGMLAQEPIEGAMNVVAARENVQPGSEIVLTGYIGGRAEPLADGRASFTLADKELTRCDANPDDACTTPWDACCVSSEIVTQSIASIQVVDEDGGVLKQSLNGWNGIQPGSTVTVAGTIAAGSSPSALIVNATKIHVNTVE